MVFHLARLRLDLHSLVAALRQGSYEVVSSPIPEGASVLAAHYDPSQHCFWVVLDHPSFPLHAEGSILPELPAIVLQRREAAVPQVEHENRG